MTKIKKRAGAYFGLHFDFHASDKVDGIGAQTTAEDWAKLLDETKPDYIQIDTKGHPGYASYATKVGTPAPGLKKDHLKIIREETAKRGISLIAHHSGLFELLAIKNHPDWAVVGIHDGKLSESIIDPLSPFADQLLVPQLVELGKDYVFNGVWLDGECWGAYENHHPDVVKEFCEKSGYKEVDKNPHSESRLAFREFCRDRFVKYLKHYISEVKKQCPDFEITDNYAYSMYMPDKPIEEIDFLSADLFDLSLRAAARIFAVQNKPWDIMRWGGMSAWVSPETGFYTEGNKHVSRLCRDAAMVISHGGGYQMVFALTNQGKLRMIDVDRIKKVSDFVYGRKEFNHLSKPIFDTYLLVSDYDRKLRFEDEEILYRGFAYDKELFNIFADSGRVAGAVLDYQVFEDEISRMKTIVIPETLYISEEVGAKLREYVKNGGSLVVCGVEACRYFEDMAQAKIKEFDGMLLYTAVEDDGCVIGYASKPTTVNVENCGVKTLSNSSCITFDLNGAQNLSNCFRDNLDYGSPAENAVIANSYGKGKVVFVGFDIISRYEKTRHPALKHIIRNALDYVNSEPVAYLEKGIERVEIVPAEKDGKLLVNIINTSEIYYDDLGKGYDGFAPLCDITVAIKCGKQPEKVILEPEHKSVEYTYDGKYVHVQIDRLDIHTIITVE